MNYFEILSSRGWEQFLIALVHTLWQGALIALLMSVALRRIPARESNLRYFVALAAQFTVLLSGLLTWSLLNQDFRHAAPSSQKHELTTAFEPSTAARSTSAIVSRLPGLPKTHAVNDPPGWVSILAALWLVGVALMLARTVTSALAASRLASGTSIIDLTILALLEQTRRELRIGRMVKVCAVAEEFGPAVVGAIWPTLVLPVSMLTGLPSETLRLIIIHELAHVRRYDYLVNLVQMLIEAILFFNPAVCWIGRQVRLEREACCDITVVRLSGHSLGYARSLAECVVRPRVSGLALSYGGTGRSPAVLERIRRLLSPAECPRDVISISGLLLVLVAGPLLLLALWSGTNNAVALAAQVLSSKERIARVRTAQAEYSPPQYSPGGKTTLKGTVQTSDEGASTLPILFYYSSDDAGGNSSMGSIGSFQRDFSVDVPSGLARLWLYPSDHAPTIVGPFDAAPGKAIVKHAQITRGIAVDPTGQPVAGAAVRIVHRQEDLSAWSFPDNGPVTATTDAAGQFTLDTLVDDSVYTISVTSKGGAHGLARNIRPGEENIRVTVRLASINANRSASVPPKRKVVLRFVASDGGGPVAGGIDVYASPSDGSTPLFKQDLQLQDSQAIIDAPVPGIVTVQPRSLLGYWCERREFEVPPGTEPRTIEVPVIPAGAIAGQILQSDGEPAVSDVDVSCLTAEAPLGLQHTSITGPNSRVDAKGQFFLSPLPIGGTYVLTASQGHNKQFSSPVKIDADRPIAHVNLRLSRTVAAEGQIVDVAGKPLPGIPVTLQFDRRNGTHAWNAATQTNPDGRFRFDDLSAEFAANYRVSVDSRKRFQPAESALNPHKGPVEMRLQPGHVITGRVIDDATGWPIPDVEFYAHPVAWQPGERYGYEAEAKSDEEGRFRFSNLPEGAIKLNDRDGLLWKTPDKTLPITTDGPEPIEVRVSLPSWSKLKPVSPQRH